MERIYNYDTLISAQHIRVLTLAPSEDAHAVLQCSLDQQEIDDPRNEYEAISYTWGDQERTDPLLCDGKTINITPNLASALLRFRSRRGPRRLWADAICINQNNPDEKGHQVSLMARIFRSSALVRVWLGNGNEGGSQALADIASLVKRTSPNAMLYRDTESEKLKALEDLRYPLKKIFSMPWFRRRWVVQELVLNGNVMFYCGTSRIPWSSLHFAFQMFSKSPLVNDLGPRTRRTIRQFGDLWRTWCFSYAFKTERGIYSLLQSFQDLECKDPKDKLYAIAGLADDVELKPKSSTGPCRDSSIIIPTYSPTVSMNEVLQDLAFKVIRFGKVFDTLAMAGASRTMEAEWCLPSWVPDVRQPGPWPVTDRTSQYYDFKLLGVPEFTSETLTLKIDVYGSVSYRASHGKLDIIQEEFPSPPLGQGSCSNSHLLSVEDVYKTPENWTTKIISDLCHDIRSWLGIDRPGPSVEDVDLMLLYLLNSQFLTEDGPGEHLTRISIKRFRELCQKRTNEDQLGPYLARAFSTRTIFCGKILRAPDERSFPDYNTWGYFGFGPRGLQPGDKIFIPSQDTGDHISALFLRPIGNEYQVLGDGLLWFPAMSSWELTPRNIEIRLL